MTSANDHVRLLSAIGHMKMHNPTLKAEVTDAQWADFGKMVAKNIFNTDDFSYALTHGALKAKDTRELLGSVRAYILTGTKP